ncbi:nuclear transport factor 2 family protein [Parendozoicomonas haliclonae]|uniref:SnoaL-like domain-containing protein n=1 Tax=Parendozoicomonas haliclonae TaxID=1960125 RepID=A0A1X7AQW0_9GAMM|nr:nuclear transport factor 2 family protein [Parendozoicomonas haliclonae]SMA50704.1 hypothetical protein EHSB41UT_04521 [Parendozoicomonas haliclonae]
MSEAHEVIAQWQVAQAITRMVNAIDSKRWSDARVQFADTVFVDYSSLNGQPGADISSSDLVHGWQELLERVLTHHMVSNFEVEVQGDKAESECHVYACHELPGLEGWDCYGRYQHLLERVNGQWLIIQMTLIVHGQKGNLEFLQQVSSQVH